MKLWKEYGAIGEASSGKGGSGGITIVVKTNVPTRSQAEIDAYRNRLTTVEEKATIDVTKESSVVKS